MTLPDLESGPLSDDDRRYICRMALEGFVMQLPEFARDEYGAAWLNRLNGLLATDLTQAERFVEVVRVRLPSVQRHLRWRDPVKIRAARGFLGTVVIFLLAAVAAALGGHWVTQQADGPDAVGNALEPTRFVWESCMPLLLLSLSALTWANPARHLLILCSALALTLAITGWALGLGVPLWALVISAGTVLARVFRTSS